MSLREGTRRKRISVLHMLGTWEGKIEGCNCPSCKECIGKGKSVSTSSKSPSKSSRGPKLVSKKVSPKVKAVQDNETGLVEECSLRISSNKESVSDKIKNAESMLENVHDKKNGKTSGMKFSGESDVCEEIGEGCGLQDHKVIGVTSSQEQLQLSTKGEMSEAQGKSKQKSEGKVNGNHGKSAAKRVFEEGPTEEIAQFKHRRTAEGTSLVDPVMIKEEPEEYLSDLDDSDKHVRGKHSDKGESRTSRRARMVTSEVENVYAKPRMIFTGRGVVRKFEPGIDRTPKSRRGRKPGKALLPVSIKQEPKDTVIVKQEVEEGNELDELQRALSEAAENISDVGEELLDAFHELGEGTKKIKQKKKTSAFFKRVESDGDKYVECNICFKVLKESSMKQHYKTHTGEKPHICDVCEARFTRKGDVERHKRLVHKNQKPFKCQKCTREFSDRKNLKAHLQNHDKAVYYGCTTCGFKFGKREYYENHIRYIHPLPDGSLPTFSNVDEDLATKQLKQLEMEERKERNAQKVVVNRNKEMDEDNEEREEEDEEEELNKEEEEEEEEEDDDDDDDDDDVDDEEEDEDDDDDDDDDDDEEEEEEEEEEDKAIEITVTEMEEQKLFTNASLVTKKDNNSEDGINSDTSSKTQDKAQPANSITSAKPGKVNDMSTTNSSLLHLFKNSDVTQVGTNVRVSKGTLSLTQTVPDTDSQDEELVNKVIAAAVSQATDTIESLQAKSGANMSGNDIDFVEEEEEEEEEAEERLEDTEDIQEILDASSYDMMPLGGVPKPSQQLAEIHITASVSGQQRKFIIQVPPGTNLNVQTPEGMEMIVNIVNQLCAGKGELDGPIEVVMNSPSNRLLLLNNKR